MLRRLSLGLVLSLLAHVGVVVVGLVAGARGFNGPVDMELAAVQVEVKDFPLGGPVAGEGDKPRPRARAKSRAPRPADTGTLAAAPGEENPKPGAPAAEEDAGPAPTSDLSAYGPEGSRVTVLMRLDRLRGTDYQAPVDELLMHLPDRRELLQGTGLDLFADFDVLLAATPNPRDPSVTFLAVKHHLEETALRAALNRGAKATDRVLSWRKEGGRLIGERRGRKGTQAPAQRFPDDRLILLSDPGLAIVTPPAYRELLLGSGAPPAAATPDGGVPAGDGAAPVLTAGASAAAAAAAAGGWATLLWRINAEEGLMPPDGAVMLKAVDLFKRAGVAAGDTAILYGMEVPPAVSGVIGIDDSPYLDVTGEFKSEGPAKHWESAWPALQRKWRTHPYAMLTGFSSLIGRATLTREGNAVRLHLSVTRDETQRLLALALQLIVGRGF